jgi:hypothetical protein
MRITRGLWLRKSPIAGAMTVLLLATSCATSQPLQPFTTDGCSLFPDRSLISKSDWCSCCLAHDLSYWQGGTEAERLNADQALRSCVRHTSGDEKLADLMFVGVRAGGGPYFFTPYRWGYGWPFGRSYAPLSSSEQAQVMPLRAKYVSTNPTLSCPSGP